MSQPPTNTLRAVEQAADLRAAGYSWELIAATVGQPVDAVCIWPDQYAEVWARRFTDTSRRLAAEAAAEARLFLRRHLRDEDAKVSQGAAKQLLDHDPSLARAETTSVSSEARQIADQLEGLSHEDLRLYFDTQLARLAQEAVGYPVGPEEC